MPGHGRITTITLERPAWHRGATVRRVLDDLDTRPWADLEHAYGAATDVPAAIRALAAGAPEWEDALGRLHASLYHQGSYFTATPVAVPYLIGALDGHPATRAAVALFLAELSGAHRFDAVVGYQPYAFRARHDDLGYPEARETVAAVRAGWPRYLPLLGDPDPEVRAVAGYLLTGCPEAAGPTVADLTARVRVEPDDLVRASQLLVLGRLAGPTAVPLVTARRVDAAPVVRAAAGVVLAVTDPQRADDATLGLLVEAACLDRPGDSAVLLWGGTPLASLAATAAAALGRVRPADAEVVLQTALRRRLARGERALTPYHWRDGPPPGADPDALELADAVLRALVTALAPLVFGELSDRELPVTRSELTDRQREVLRWTVDHDLPVPVAAVPWPDAARMARFLDGPDGPLDHPLAVDRDGHPDQAPTWRWFWELDATRSEALEAALLRALAGQRTPAALVALARDTLSCAYRRDAWPARPVRLIRRALEPDAARVVADLEAWAGELDEHSDREAAAFVVDLLAAARPAGTVLPERLDRVLASAVTVGEETAERLLAPLGPDRRLRIVGLIENPYWRRKLAHLAGTGDG